MIRLILLLSAAFLGLPTRSPAQPDLAAMREQVLALGELTAAPAVFRAEGMTATGTIRPLFFEGRPWRGKPTRVFAWLGLPAGRNGPVPGVVLVSVAMLAS